MTTWKLVLWLVADVRQSGYAVEWLLVLETLPVPSRRIAEPVAQQKLGQYDVQNLEATPEEAVVWSSVQQEPVLLAGVYSEQRVQIQEADRHQRGQPVLAEVLQLAEAGRWCHGAPAKQNNNVQQPWY